MVSLVKKPPMAPKEKKWINFWPKRRATNACGLALLWGVQWWGQFFVSSIGWNRKGKRGQIGPITSLNGQGFQSTKGRNKPQRDKQSHPKNFWPSLTPFESSWCNMVKPWCSTMKLQNSWAKL
jgi:hypothetical protein